ncbi:NAD(P)/FAD-dependent oxidoreductase [Mycobacterium sp. MYCO198283]|uniref:flavin-containing monooxygenase n=1 Tax=Mycobacterium sp. MYCO198283 TaxID=2883505 RepID=UPI001E4038EA|nr:NAD(P)/FAD-dependent oxidoreductase [Mycobacterium sp. MYCO198283]MCG5434025.1 NAD(P)/FAD-dependent oxidoreductase [Mycobacterium sp. MYCO198283]
MAETSREPAVVVGAGPCGLAIARQLRVEQGVDALVVDRAAAPAASWRRLYEGFRLNTCGFWSHLPGQRIPLRHGRWPTRDDMVGYFDDYVRRQRLRLRLRVAVRSIDRDGEAWCIDTDGGPVLSSAVVVATGNYRTRQLPGWPGADAFTGTLLHAADYRDRWPFLRRDVLVVGAGNTATDIVGQLCDGVARSVTMAVRTPPHLVPRAVAGIPVDAFTGPLGRLPAGAANRTAAVASRLWFGDLRARGLPPPREGILTALERDARIPILADELVAHVKAGRVTVVPPVASFDGPHVELADGRRITPDVVIAATGYHPGLAPLVGHLGVLDAAGHPVSNGVRSAAPGLWFAGYDEPLIGPLRSFRRQATPLAAAISRYLAAVARR